MSKDTFRVVTRGADGKLRIRDYNQSEPLLRMHTQIGVDDCSTDLAPRPACLPGPDRPDARGQERRPV